MFYDSDVDTLTDKKSQELHSALWMYNVCPVAIKVAYIKQGAPLHAPRYPWYPDRPSKIVKLGPYHGSIEPNAGPKAIVPPDS